MSELPPSRKFSFRQRASSFRCAIRGIGWLIRTEHNAKIHVAVTLVVIVLGAALRISRIDWCWLVTAITLVWTAEALNSALEHLADVAAPAIHPTTARAKDIAAGAVLLASLGAAAIGAIVLGPHVIEWARS